ncbi:MAG: hypothetical protein KDD64_04905 [Bdellovibrionales bacterium]|nr:hypothetical protein [Bdellovibrionales bacterium]
MKRRNFLSVLFLSLLHILLPGCASPRARNLDALNRFLLSLDKRKQLSLLGEKYLSLYPEERERNLKAVLLSEAPTNIPNMTSYLQDRLAQDFRTREIAQVSRWELSRTEARICALVHLSEA